MVFRDDNPVREIDNELKIFRKLFKNNTEDRNYLIINQAGMISQHIVEYEARLKENITHNIYNSTFEDFVDECDFIKGSLREYVLILRDCKNNNVISIEFGEDFDEQLLSFIESFHIFLLIYRNYNAVKPKEDSKYGNFKELHDTVTFLEKQISIMSEHRGKYEFNERPQQDETVKIDAAIQMLTEIKERQDYHIGVSEDTNRIANQILEELKKLDEDFNDYRDLIENSLEKELTEDEFEKIMSKFSDKCVKKIRSSIEKDILNSKDCKIMKEELTESLGKSAWNKLSRQSKRFLITSKITFNSLCELEDIIDYSGVCLLVTKALEVELIKRFYKGFYKYLENNNKSFEEYHTSLVERDENGDLKKLPDYKRTLGGIPYLLCYKEHENRETHEKNASILIEYSKENLFRDLSDEDIRKTLRKYGKEIRNITFKYRNTAAHTNELRCRQAKKCLDFVIDVEHFLKNMLDSFDKEDNL